MVCLRNISVDTLHKGDTDDDDDDDDDDDNNNNNNNNNNNGLAEVIHQKLAEAAELTEDKSLYYKYTPANVLENNHLSCIGTIAYLRTKQYPLTGLT